MMGGIRIGKLFGIPIRLSGSFLLLLGVFLLWQGLSGVLGLLVLFASVLVHELGHALVARRHGVSIIGIDLHFFGGAAKLTQMPDSPRTEIAIAAAGPAVSFVLGLAAFGLYVLTGFSPLRYVAIINALLGGFNLLPALPMDGGRILRALLSRRMGHLRATTAAVKVARICALGLGGVGLVGSSFFTVALAVMLWLMAGAELRQARVLSFARGAGWGTSPNASGDQPEILDRFGRPVRGAGAMPGMTGFTVEEQLRGGVRCWVIRDPDGQVIFMCNQPR
jgi:Zn-dependent protease